MKNQYARRGCTQGCFLLTQWSKGFTLLEILVVVLIIGILGAIALPQYQRAVLKSRYSGMMPIAKAMADSNEIYFLEHGNYAGDPQAFQVQGRRDYADGTHLDFGTTTDYAYVLAKNEEKLPNNTYVVYQKHSVNYPGEIHCEALADNDLAEGVCKSFGATQHIGSTITPTHNTWLLEGSRGAGIEPEALEDEQDETGQTAVSCTAAEAMGYTCNMSTNEQGAPVKQVCTTIGSGDFCRTRTYNEDGSYTSVTCKVDNEGVCTANLKSATYLQTATYDANGNMLTSRSCSSVDINGNCTAYSNGYNYTYDSNGNKLTERRCDSFDSNGNCTAYSTSSSYDYTYDANGNQLTRQTCSSVDNNGNCTAYSGRQDYTYDANGNQLTRRDCSGSNIDSNGNCTAYSYGEDYTYDANGNQLTRRDCSGVDSNGNCTSYRGGGNYTYDANGNKLTVRNCKNGSVDSNGNCTAYSSGNNSTYDANGNMLTLRSCSSVNSSGNCTAYSYGNDYTYDTNGNVLTFRQCQSVNSSGNCTGYTSGTDYTYDANGNKTERNCTHFDSKGNCTSYATQYVTGKHYVYDESGKEMFLQYCKGANVNSATGECTVYDYAMVYDN